MATFEPITQAARETIVRAQEVAQMFGSSYIGTEHLLFALADRDDELGRELAQAVDRNAIKERLGAVRREPQSDMAFTDGAKHSMEMAYANARRLEQNFVSRAHLALGVLGAEPPPLRSGFSLDDLTGAIDRIARADDTHPPLFERKGTVSD